ncbi:MAG: hypothetical protein AAGM84_09560 [Pseudomonadota bacterium]
MWARIKDWIVPPGPRYRIDALAFLLALVLAPLIVTAVTFPIGGFSIFTLFFGGPIYLAVGTPLLLWHLRFNPPEYGRIAMLGLRTLIVGLIFWAATMNSTDWLSVLPAISAITLIFGLAWVWVFALIYIKVAGRA